MFSGDPATWSAPQDWSANDRWRWEHLRSLASHLHAMNPAWRFELVDSDSDMPQLIVLRDGMPVGMELAAVFAERDPADADGGFYTLHRFGDEDGKGTRGHKPF